MKASQLLSLALLVGCGAAPAVRDEGVSLTQSPTVGTRYEGAIQAQDRIASRRIDFLETFHVTYEVRAINADGMTLHGSVDHSRVDARGGPVRLPPASNDTPCESELHIDRRGALLRLEGSVLCAGTLAQPWVEALLPEGPVHVGDTWAMADGLATVGSHGIVVPRAGETLTLASSDGARAEVTWNGDLHVGPVEIYDEPVTMVRHVEGSASLALSDGIARTGTWRASANYTPATPRALVMDAETARWCIAREGEPPCEAFVPEEDTRDIPAAHVYEGEACTTRLAALDATLAGLTAFEVAEPGAVPTVDHGTEPIEAVAPRIVVSANELEIDGRTQTLQGVQDDLATMERNWSMLHPHSEFPHRVHLFVAPATPASALEALITALGPTTTIDLVVETGAAPAVMPALPSWIAPLPTDPAEAATAMSRAWSAAIGGCPAAIAGFGGIAIVDSQARPALLRTVLAEGLASCHCGGADIDAVEALGARTVGGSQPSLGSLVIPAGNTGPTLRVRGTAADLATALAARATPGAPVRFRWR